TPPTPPRYIGGMDFGAVPDPTGIDFAVPPLDPRCVARWSRPDAPFRLHTGAPMWGEKAWLGTFYPENLPQRAWLAAYAERLGAVEHNSTFYAVPTPAQVAAWAAQTPPGFRFCPKVPRTVSHAGDWRVDAPRFGEAVRAFGDRLGPVLFQVSEDVGPEHLSEIAARVEALGPGLRVAVEVRHPGFFPGGRLLGALLAWMERTDRIAVVTDTPGRRDVVHASLPTRALYLRFKTADGHPVDEARTDAWVERLAAWRDAGLWEAWLFVHQRDGIGLLGRLERFHAALSARLDVPLPTRLLRPPPPRLFGG
ncbi:MAG: DUF72 domain-containing protein, partial [Myxococcota bacterium]